MSSPNCQFPFWAVRIEHFLLEYFVNSPEALERVQNLEQLHYVLHYGVVYDWVTHVDVNNGDYCDTAYIKLVISYDKPDLFRVDILPTHSSPEPDHWKHSWHVW